MDSKALSAVIATFAAKFLNELEKNKSVVSSPLSAEIVLALLTLGTSDPAHSELLTALGISSDEAIRSSFSSVSSKLRSVKGVTLNVANKVYLPEGPYELQQQIQEDAVKVFDAGIEKVNFKNKTAAAQLINSWVESKTNNRIKDLLSPSYFNEATRLVFVNAIYFKGSWKMKFDSKFTKDLPFYVNAKTTIDVPMMYKEGNYKYSESQELNAQLLQLPYEGDEASMVIVLPNEIEGLSSVLQKLADGHDLITELDKMHLQKFRVTIPKFKIETEIDLKIVLPKLGINTIFNHRNTCLDKLLKNSKRLYVSAAIQKAFIEVNEEGAEAAAATGMVKRIVCNRKKASPSFVADRPFLYALLDAADANMTLFVGVYHPQQAGACTTDCTKPS